MTELQKIEDMDKLRGRFPALCKKMTRNRDLRRQGIDPKARLRMPDGTISKFPPSMTRPKFIDQLLATQRLSLQNLAPYLIQSDGSWLMDKPQATTTAASVDAVKASNPDVASNEPTSAVQLSLPEAVPCQPSSRYQFNLTDKDIEAVVSEEHVAVVKHLLSLEMSDQRAINMYNKKVIQAMLGHHALDCGSAEVQVGLLSLRIISLCRHVAAFRKDQSAKNLLIQLIQRRKKYLKFLRSMSLQRYFALMERLSIVHTDLI